MTTLYPTATLADRYLNMLRGTAGTAAAATYVALFDGDPGIAGTSATEVTNTIRSAGRVEIEFAAPVNGRIVCTAGADFGLAEASATLGGFGIYDSASGGVLLAHGAYETATVGAGNLVAIEPGALSIGVPRTAAEVL